MGLKFEMNVHVPSRGRFGTAISSLTDVNGDGLRDVAVGAPLENNHRGAVYIYLGDKHRGIRNTFSQVRRSKDDITLVNNVGFHNWLQRGLELMKYLFYCKQASDSIASIMQIIIKLATQCNIASVKTSYTSYITENHGRDNKFSVAVLWPGDRWND